MCTTLLVAPSGYYAWQKQKISKRQQEDTIFSEQIKQAFDASDQTCGYLRIWKELQSQGVNCGKYRIARLMQANGWVVKVRKRFKTTTKSDPTHVKAPNHLQRDFSATRVNEKWTTDITYIKTGEGWLYLAVVLDLFSRRIVGWAMDRTMDKQLVLAALTMAVAQRTPPHGLLHHSDRGSQYTSHAYQKALTRFKMRSSMSGTGNC
jgi:transposase InsO family protein